jgi:putative transposase
MNQDGYREVLGVRIGDSKSRASRSELFTWLKSHGLHIVDFVVSDDHSGLAEAIETHFQGRHGSGARSA